MCTGNRGIELIPIGLMTVGAAGIIPTSSWMVFTGDRIDIVMTRCTSGRLWHCFVVIAIGAVCMARGAITHILRPRTGRIIVARLPVSDNLVWLTRHHTGQILSSMDFVNQHSEIDRIAGFRVNGLAGMARST